MKNPAVSHIYNPDLITNGRFNGKVQFNLDQLIKAVKGRPCVISPWNDLYHEGVTDEQRDMAFAVMAMANEHTYLIITKRIENATRYWTGSDLPDPSYRALGIALQAVKMGFEGTLRDKLINLVHKRMWTIPTCENQKQADKRIPHLLKIPGKRGIIIEPMLGGVDLQKTKAMWYTSGVDTYNHTQIGSWNSAIHQVILGPENGPGKRPFDPAWADSVRGQCEAAGVPFYRKDTGEGTLVWRPTN
jgi:protein gp37